MPDDDELLLKVSSDTTQAVSGLAELNKSLGQISGQLYNLLNLNVQASQNFTQMATTMTRGMTGAGVATSGWATTVTGLNQALQLGQQVMGIYERNVGSLIRTGAEFAHQMTVQAQMVGTNVEQFQALDIGMKLASGGMGSALTTLRILSRNMEQMAGGSMMGAKAAFKELKVSVVDSDGYMRSLSSVMDELTVKFSKLPDGPHKTALAIGVFSRYGAAAIPLMNDIGATGMKVKEYFEKLGLVMGKDMVDAATKYNNALETSEAQSKMFWQVIGAEMAPAFQKLRDQIIESKAAAIEWVTAHREQVLAAAQAVAGAMEVLHNWFQSLVRVMRDHLPAIQEFAVSGMSFLAKSALKAAEAIGFIASQIERLTLFVRKPQPRWGILTDAEVEQFNKDKKIWDDTWTAMETRQASGMSTIDEAKGKLANWQTQQEGLSATRNLIMGLAEALQGTSSETLGFANAWDSLVAISKEVEAGYLEVDSATRARLVSLGLLTDATKKQTAEDERGAKPLPNAKTAETVARTRIEQASILSKTLVDIDRIGLKEQLDLHRVTNEEYIRQDGLLQLKLLEQHVETAKKLADLATKSDDPGKGAKEKLAVVKAESAVQEQLIKNAADLKKAQQDTAEATKTAMDQVATLEEKAFGTPAQQRIQALQREHDVMIKMLTDTKPTGWVGAIAQVDAAYAKMTENAKAGVIDLRDTISTGLEDAFQGVILGTKGKGFGDILQGFGDSIKKQMAKGFADALIEKSGFDTKMNVNFLETLPAMMGTSAGKMGQIFSNLFSLLGSGKGVGPSVNVDETSASFTGGSGWSLGSLSGGGGGGGGLLGLLGFGGGGTIGGLAAGQMGPPTEAMMASGGASFLGMAGPGLALMGVGSLASGQYTQAGLMFGGAGASLAYLGGTYGAGSWGGAAGIGGGALGALAGGVGMAAIIGGGIYNALGEGHTTFTPGTGSLMGAGGGALSGAAIGSFFPVIGTAIGAVIGAIIGGIMGSLGSSGPTKEHVAMDNVRDAFEKSRMLQYEPAWADWSILGRPATGPDSIWSNQGAGKGGPSFNMLFPKGKAGGMEAEKGGPPGTGVDVLAPAAKTLAWLAFDSNTNGVADQFMNSFTNNARILGLTAKQAADQLLLFAKTAGVDLPTALGKLNQLLMDGDVKTEDYIGTITSLARLFGEDLPESLDLAAIAQRNLIDTGDKLILDTTKYLKDLQEVSQTFQAFQSSIKSDLLEFFAVAFPTSEQLARQNQERIQREQTIESLKLQIQKAKEYGDVVLEAELKMQLNAAELSKQLAEEALDPHLAFMKAISNSLRDAILEGIVQGIIESAAVQAAMGPVVSAIKLIIDTIADPTSTQAMIDAAFGTLDTAVIGFGETMKKILPYLDKVGESLQPIIDFVTGLGTTPKTPGGTGQPPIPPGPNAPRIAGESPLPGAGGTTRPPGGEPPRGGTIPPVASGIYKWWNGKWTPASQVPADTVTSTFTPTADGGGDVFIPGYGTSHITAEQARAAGIPVGTTTQPTIPVTPPVTPTTPVTPPTTPVTPPVTSPETPVVVPPVTPASGVLKWWNGKWTPASQVPADAVTSTFTPTADGGGDISIPNYGSSHVTAEQARTAGIPLGSSSMSVSSMGSMRTLSTGNVPVNKENAPASNLNETTAILEQEIRTLQAVLSTGNAIPLPSNLNDITATLDRAVRTLQAIMVPGSRMAGPSLVVNVSLSGPFVGGDAASFDRLGRVAGDAIMQSIKMQRTLG